MDCPYRAGETLKLRVAEESSELLAPVVDAQIVETFAFCCSCAMVVEVPALTGSVLKCVLKLFDRRFLHGYRRNHHLATWTNVLEAGFKDFMNDDEGPWMKGPDGSEDEAVFFSTSSGTTHRARDMLEELDMCKMLRFSFDNETAVYERLADLQGTDLPRMFGRVLLLDENTEGLDYRLVKGILLEHIVGFELDKIHSSIPRTYWQAIMDDSMRLLGATQDRDVFHASLKAEHFLVVPKVVDKRPEALPTSPISTTEPPAKTVARRASHQDIDKAATTAANEAEGPRGLKRSGSFSDLDNPGTSSTAPDATSSAFPFRLVMLDFGRSLTRTDEGIKEWMAIKAAHDHDVLGRLAREMSLLHFQHGFLLGFRAWVRVARRAAQKDREERALADLAEAARLHPVPAPVPAPGPDETLAAATSQARA